MLCKEGASRYYVAPTCTAMCKTFARSIDIVRKSSYFTKVLPPLYLFCIFFLWI